MGWGGGWMEGGREGSFVSFMVDVFGRCDRSPLGQPALLSRYYISPVCRAKMAGEGGLGPTRAPGVAGHLGVHVLS